MLECYNLTGRVAVVTGSSKGLGRAFAKALAKAGASVFGIARCKEELISLKEELDQVSSSFDYYVADLTDEESVSDAVSRCIKIFGKVDILVNNAGSGRVNIPFEDISLEQWRKTIDNNLTSAFLCCKHFGREMIRQKSGKIVNLASMSGMIANKGVHCGPYEVSKLGMVALTKSLASEWAKHHINVNALAPGYIATERNSSFFEANAEFTKLALDMTPVGRFPVPDELGGTIVYLCSDASNYMNGAVLLVDGGYTVW